MGTYKIAVAISKNYWIEFVGIFVTFILSRVSKMSLSSLGGLQYMSCGLGMLVSMLACRQDYRIHISVQSLLRYIYMHRNVGIWFQNIYIFILVIG